MIRLNAFFELKSDKDTQVLAATMLAKDLVAQSRQDDGCIDYDFFKSTTRPGVMMFCETWRDQAALDAHSASAHFLSLVPQIEALTKNGMHLNRFEI